MIEANIIARSHFTRKVDGKTSFETFKRAVGLQGENLPFEYQSNSMGIGPGWSFVIESWGGYSSASGEWVIFMAWRCSKTRFTQYIHWSWDEKKNMCSNRRNYSFVG